MNIIYVYKIDRDGENKIIVKFILVTFSSYYFFVRYQL